MLEGKHMTVASAGKQRQTSRPRPTTTSDYEYGAGRTARRDSFYVCTGKPRTSLRVRTPHIRRMKCACRRILLQVPQKCRMRATIELISFQFSSFLTGAGNTRQHPVIAGRS